jgi:hypothetical protein
MNPGPADLEFVSFVTTSALPQVEGASSFFCWKRNAKFGWQRPT